MNVIRWLVHKDLARFFADRNGALLTFIIPMALAALLGSLFGQDDKATAVELLVVNRDESAETQSLVKALEADENLSRSESGNLLATILHIIFLRFFFAFSVSLFFAFSRSLFHGKKRPAKIISQSRTKAAAAAAAAAADAF